MVILLGPPGAGKGTQAQRIAQSDRENGFILDGFPRTLAQAVGLEGICRLYKSRSTTVLNVAVQPDLVVRRLTNRRICKMRGHIYNLADRSPIHPGICDADGSELMQRPDDAEDVIRERIHAYERHTRPLIDYYSAQGLLYEVDGVGDPDAVMTDIKKVLDREDPTK